MCSIRFNICFVLLLSICFIISSSFSLQNNKFNTPSYLKSKQYNTRLYSDISVSSTPQGGGSPRPNKTFIISPSTQNGPDELLILQNFNQIQSGDRKKIGEFICIPLLLSYYNCSLYLYLLYLCFVIFIIRYTYFSTIIHVLSYIGILGSQDVSDNHSQMIELLSYALILSGNHVYTSGGGKGTNIAVIRGALRACNPDLLTVILPQSLTNQPVEMQPLLLRVSNLIEQSNNDNLDLKDAAVKCNESILQIVDKVLIFCYHDSNTILNSLKNTEDNLEKILFYLD